MAKRAFAPDTMGVADDDFSTGRVGHSGREREAKEVCDANNSRQSPTRRNIGALYHARKRLG